MHITLKAHAFLSCLFCICYACIYMLCRCRHLAGIDLSAQLADFFMHTNTHTLNILGGTWTFWEFPLRMRSATVLEGETICTHHDGQFYWLSTAN